MSKSKKTDSPCNVVPKPDKAATQAAFAKTIARRDDGGNNPNVERLLTAIDIVTSAKPTFTLTDVSRYTHGIPGPELARLWQKYCDYMERNGMITIINGCYDEPVISLV